MSDFDKFWKEEACGITFDYPHEGAEFAWNHQQQKIDEVRKYIDSFYAEAELWGFDSDQALHQINLIQELLK